MQAAGRATTSRRDVSLEDALRRRILEQTNGAVGDLEVRVDESRAVLSGRTRRYYYKQVATSVALELIGDRALRNEIRVATVR